MVKVTLNWSDYKIEIDVSDILLRKISPIFWGLYLDYKEVYIPLEEKIQVEAMISIFKNWSPVVITSFDPILILHLKNRFELDILPFGYPEHFNMIPSLTKWYIHPDNLKEIISQPLKGSIKKLSPDHKKLLFSEIFKVIQEKSLKLNVLNKLRADLERLMYLMMEEKISISLTFSPLLKKLLECLIRNYPNKYQVILSWEPIFGNKDILNSLNYEWNYEKDNHRYIKSEFLMALIRSVDKRSEDPIIDIYQEEVKKVRRIKEINRQLIPLRIVYERLNKFIKARKDLKYCLRNNNKATAFSKELDNEVKTKKASIYEQIDKLEWEKRRLKY